MQDEVKTIEAGKYTLVARFNKGAHRGALWSDGKVVDEVEGDSLNDAWKKLCDRLYARLVEAAGARKGTPPTSHEAKVAFLSIEKRLTAGHKAMLRAHLNAEGRQITATKLADAAGYARYSAANLQYGLLGAMLFAEMPEELPKRGDGSPIMTCAIASSDDFRGSEEEQWIWQMRPHISEGLAASGIL
jgi:hypothetical protein